MAEQNVFNLMQNDEIGLLWKKIYQFNKILYPIFDYPHEHYTFKHFEV